MKRKFLARHAGDVSENSEDESSQSEIEKLDPFDVNDRKFGLQENENEIQTQFEATQEEVDEAKKDAEKTSEFMQATNDEIKQKVEHIKNVKKLHDSFDQEMQLLKDGKAPSMIDVEEDLESLKNFSETGEITTKMTNLIQKSSEQKLKVMKLQLENERKQSEKFSNLVKENMKQIIEVDDILKQQLGNEVTEMIENNVKRKLKVLELQLENETKHSQELNKIVEKDMYKVSKFDKEIREEKEKLANEVKEKTERLVKAERLSAIGELAARVAHDLRNPLSVIKAAIELITVKSGASSPIQKQIGMIERSIGRMSHQIEDVLDFVKPVPLQLETHSLLDTINAAIEKSNIPETVSLELPKGDIEFPYDSDKMDVVFDNIFTNASQAIEGNGEIKVEFVDSKNLAEIKIQDSGPGIPEEILEKVFEPLVTTKQRGTGLGLASCKSIVEQHKGTISTKNNPTTFVIKIPKNLQ